MKEYKAVSWKMGLSKNNQRLEDELNNYARQGWEVIHIAENHARIVLERTKN